MGSETIKKNYLEKVSATQFRNVEIPYKPVEFWVFPNAKTGCETPYKTCWIWRLSEPKIESELRNDWKSITQRRFSQHDSKTSKTLIKPVEYWCFWTSTVSIFWDSCSTRWGKKTPGVFYPLGRSRDGAKKTPPPFRGRKVSKMADPRVFFTKMRVVHRSCQ